MVEKNEVFVDPVLPPIDPNFEPGKNLTYDDLEGINPPAKKAIENEELLKRAEGKLEMGVTKAKNILMEEIVDPILPPIDPHFEEGLNLTQEDTNDIPRPKELIEFVNNRQTEE